MALPTSAITTPLSPHPNPDTTPSPPSHQGSPSKNTNRPPTHATLDPDPDTPPLSISASMQSLTEHIASERHEVDRNYGLECTINQPYRQTQQHRLQHPTMYRLCTGGLLTGDLLHALLHHQTADSPICTRHIDSYVRDPTHTNTPSRALLRDLFQAPVWPFSITITDCTGDSPYSSGENTISISSTLTH